MKKKVNNFEENKKLLMKSFSQTRFCLHLLGINSWLNNSYDTDGIEFHLSLWKNKTKEKRMMRVYFSLDINFMKNAHPLDFRKALFDQMSLLFKQMAPYVKYADFINHNNLKIMLDLY